MNNPNSFSAIEDCNESVDALKRTLHDLTEKYAVLEQKYLEASKRCAALEQQASAAETIGQRSDGLLSNLEDNVLTLKKISASIDESLAHSWSMANHPLFKFANKAVRVMEHAQDSKIHSVMEPLDSSKRYLNALLEEYYHSVMPKPVVSDTLSADELPQNTPLHSVLHSKYRKFDVLIFGTIDYEYLYQRPQHFADYFASMGHRVFYVNASFHHGYDYRICEKKENLFLVTLPCFSSDAVNSADLSDTASETAVALENLLFHYGICDGVMIADHPNWVHLMLHLKETRGFALITDYMDDFTGFEHKEQDLVVKSCLLLLQNSDLVIASSLYLEQQASKFNPNVMLIRNGTDFSHFHAAYREPMASQRKVIGYYGVVSSWFDYKKIKYLSSRFPQHDIVLIGDVLDSKKKFFEPLKNVQLLGVKPYSVLPEYLKTFDVCLIPFDSSLSLIKATNPVKFYEYLSAAKKVVATEMPELEPFRNQYVYLANDNKTFGDYVELCLNGKDTLANAEDCMRFARENDWQERAKKFAECVNAQFAKVTIVLDDRLCDSDSLCVESIRANTAYPNYTIVPLGEISAETFRNCDYVVFLNANAIVSRGWLSGLLQTISKSRAKAVCPSVFEMSDAHDAAELPLHMYVQAAKNAIDPICVADDASAACVMLSAELAASLNLSCNPDISAELSRNQIDLIKTNTVLIKTNEGINL